MKNENGFTSIDPIIEPSEDKVYRLANAVASIVPTGSNIFQAIFTNPIQNRTNAWMEDVEAKIVELVKLGEIDLEALAKRPEFSAIMLRVMQEVEITSQKEKLEYLCNFVVNLAKGIDVEEDELYIMMDIIKSLTPSHIRAVQLYNRPFWFTDRFRELAVFWDTVGLGELRLDVKVYKELAIIFHKDRDTNVLHHNIELIDDDVSNYHDHWKLVINQLDNLLLVSKPSDEIKGYSSVKVTRENGKASFKVNLKRQLSMRGFLLLDLIEG